MPNGVATKPLPKGLRYQHHDLLFMLFNYYNIFFHNQTILQIPRPTIAVGFELQVRPFSLVAAQNQNQLQKDSVL